jgi:hypothetical protein
MNPLQLTRRIVIAVGALCVGGSAAALVLGVLAGLSESHAGTPAMLRHLNIQVFVAAGAPLWSIFALFKVIERGSRLDLAALVGESGQLVVFGGAVRRRSRVDGGAGHRRGDRVDVRGARVVFGHFAGLCQGLTAYPNILTPWRRSCTTRRSALLL